MKNLLLLYTIIYVHSTLAQYTGITNLSPKDYSAHTQNWAITQDPCGRYYVANTSGILVCYGDKWLTISLGENSNATSLALHPNGRIYCGGYGDFGYLKPDSVGNLSFQSLLPLLPDSLKNFTNIWQTNILPTGEVCFNAIKYLFIHDPLSQTKTTKLRCIKPQLGSFFFGFNAGKEYWILQSNGQGYYKLQGDSLAFVPGTEVFAKNAAYTLLPINDTTWLAGTLYKGIYRIEKTAASIQSSPLLDSLNPLHLALTKAQIGCGAVWKNAFDAPPHPSNLSENSLQHAFAFGTNQDGIFLLNADGDLLRHINRKDGLQNERVWSLATDNQNRLLAALDKGFSFITPNLPYQFFAEGEGFSGSVTAVIRYPANSPSGRVYVATAQGVWVHNETRQSDQFSTKQTITAWQRVRGIADQCWTFYDSPLGLLIGSGTGLYQLKPQPSANSGAIAESPKAQKIGNNNHSTIISLVFDCEKAKKHHHQWIAGGGREGIQIWKPKSDSYTWLQSIPDIGDEILSLALDSSTENIRYWAGTWAKGVYGLKFGDCPDEKKPDGSLVYQITPADSLKGMESGYVGRIFSREKNLMFTHERLGVLRYNNETNGFERDLLFNAMFKKSPLDTVRVAEISLGSDGNCWLSYGKKIWHIKSRPNGWKYDTLGFLGMDIGNIHSIYRDPLTQNGKNYVWFGGDDGLMRYDMDSDIDYRKSFPLFLQEVRSSRDSLVFGGVYQDSCAGGVQEEVGRCIACQQANSSRPEFSYDMNEFHFQFCAFFKDNEDKVRYRWKLIGYDTTYTKWADRNYVDYTNLAEGDYTFMAVAKNVYEQHSNTVIYKFRINPPFHRTTLFYALEIFGLLLIAGMSFWLSRTRFGWGTKMAIGMAMVVLFVIFELVQNFLEDFLPKAFQNVPVVKVFFGVVLGFLFTPVERLLRRYFAGKQKLERVDNVREVKEEKRKAYDRVREEERKAVFTELKEMSDEEIVKIVRS